MEVQTERLEAQQARLTVSLTTERLENAKRAAARRLSKRNNIPGFRKGKAPYPIVLRNFGEAAIVEETLETLGNQVYREALEQSELLAYGPGRLEDFVLQPKPQFTFTVPLQPEVELNNYRQVRLEYEETTISDEDLAKQLKALRYQHAVFEESRSSNVENGDRVALDFHITFTDDPEGVEGDDDLGEKPLRGSDFARGEEQSFWLDPEEEPVLTGFRAALIGAALDEEREFALQIPNEETIRSDIIGRSVNCRVKVRKIEKVTLPQMNDNFAAQLTKDEAEPLTLLQLRQRIRENMQKQASEQARSQYIQAVQNDILAQASVLYPEAMLEDETSARMEHFGEDLQKRYGIKLPDYLRLEGKDEEEMRAEFRPEAKRHLSIWLLRDAIRAKEYIEISAEQTQAEIEKMLAEMGDAADERLRGQYHSTEFQQRIAHALLQREIDERIFAIGQGLALASPEETPTEKQTPEAKGVEQ